MIIGCAGGTEENPCQNGTKYTLEWIMEDTDLCAEHYENERNAKTLREQIAQEIEANCGFIQFCTFGDCTCGEAAAIARGRK